MNKNTSISPFFFTFADNHHRTIPAAATERIHVRNRTEYSPSRLTGHLYETRPQFMNKSSYGKKDQSAKQLLQRYRSIESILVSQNQNLRQQNKYLLDCLHKTTNTNKKMQTKLEFLQSQHHSHQKYINQLQSDLIELRQYIREHVKTVNILLKLNNIDQLKQLIRQFAVSMNDILCLHGSQEKYAPDLNQQTARFYYYHPICQYQCKDKTDHQLQSLLKKQTDKGIRQFKMRQSPIISRFYSETGHTQQDKIYPHNKFKTTNPKKGDHRPTKATTSTTRHPTQT